MYEERRERFSFRDIILQLIFIILFVFILIYLFPSKSDLNGINNKLDVLTNRIFNENIQTMKDAAIRYYTTPRLPQKVGESKKMTLGEMLDKHLLIQFTDANGQLCSNTGSYVEITKYEDEYRMKVNLKCTDNDAYIMVYLGCYDYCDTDVCERESSKPVENEPTKPTPSKPVIPERPKPPKPPVEKEYIYEYIKYFGATCSNWSSWSSWTTNEITATANREVRTQDETIKETVQVLVGHKESTFVDYDSPIYEQKKIQTGTETVNKCTSYKMETYNTGEVKYQWVSQGTAKYYTKPTPNATTKYEFISAGTEVCGDCAYSYYEIYEKFTLKSYNVTAQREVCAKWENVTEPVYMTVNEIVGYKTWTEKTPIYANVEQSKTVKYYSSRTRTCQSSYSVTKWSYYGDRSLLNDGYDYTGRKSEK